MRDYLEDAAQKREYQPDLNYACLLTMFDNQKKSLNRIMDLIEQDTYIIFDTIISRSAVCESARG